MSRRRSRSLPLLGGVKEWRISDWKIQLNSQPRPIYGQQYPFLFFLPDFPIVSRAAATEGQCPVEYRGYFVHTYVCPSVRPSVLFVRRLIVSADLGALTWWPWPGGLGLKALGLKALGPRPEALPWRPAHKVETMAWRPKPGGLQD